MVKRILRFIVDDDLAIPGDIVCTTSAKGAIVSHSAQCHCYELIGRVLSAEVVNHRLLTRLEIIEACNNLGLNTGSEIVTALCQKNFRLKWPNESVRTRLKETFRPLGGEMRPLSTIVEGMNKVGIQLNCKELFPTLGQSLPKLSAVSYLDKIVQGDVIRFPEVVSHISENACNCGQILARVNYEFFSDDSTYYKLGVLETCPTTNLKVGDVITKSHDDLFRTSSMFRLPWPNEVARKELKEVQADRIKFVEAKRNALKLETNPGEIK